jgi:hypothetical protein
MRMTIYRAGLIALVLGLPLQPIVAGSAPTPIWPNTAAARAEAATRLDLLQHELLSQPSTCRH